MQNKQSKTMPHQIKSSFQQQHCHHHPCKPILKRNQYHQSVNNFPLSLLSITTLVSNL
eukprot:UN00121